MKKAKFTVSLPVVVKKKNAMWISSCPCLDVISQGGTEEEAKKNIEEALQLFITTCFERGTLEAVMKECGFSLIINETKYVRKESQKGKNRINTVNIPIPFYVKGNSATECRA